MILEYLTNGGRRPNGSYAWDPLGATMAAAVPHMLVLNEAKLYANRGREALAAGADTLRRHTGKVFVPLLGVSDHGPYPLAVLPSPGNAPAIRLNNRPGTDTTGCPVARSKATSRPAAPEVMSTAHMTSDAFLVVRMISYSIAAWPLATFRENTTGPFSSTAHAWWTPFPTSIPTHILHTATRPVLLPSQLNPVDDPPAAP
jgi:hypothetical protein